MEKSVPRIKALFLDVGGVLLSNGWDHHARQAAANHFGYDYTEVEARHQVVTDVHETGNITLEEYLDHVVFYRVRSFDRGEYRTYMEESSTADQPMIDLMRGLKARYGLKVFTVNNEARELNAYRIRTFGLAGFVDAFVSSCYVGIRKPDKAIFQLALDMARVDANEVVYIDNTGLLVEMASPLGMRAIVHKDFATTRSELIGFGLDYTA